MQSWGPAHVPDTPILPLQALKSHLLLTGDGSDEAD